jgi:hypothetical protein
MNASSPPPGAQLFTITFIGSQGATLTFPLIAGADIRDYAQGIFANTLTNGISGVQALGAFSCVDPATCLGSGGSGNVLTGEKATYVADEQHFSLGTAFIGQTLTQIVLTDTYGGKPQLLLMGATVGSLGAPSISSGGVVPIDSPVNTIESGSWISIYGTNLAAASATWYGDFPIMLGGTSVTIGNQPAYLSVCEPDANQCAGSGRQRPGAGQCDGHHAGGQQHIHRNPSRLRALLLALHRQIPRCHRPDAGKSRQ